MYECLNVVGGDIGSPEAVLLRALEPVEGIEIMAKRRRIEQVHPRTLRQLCSGPGKLTQAMGITRTEHYGIDLCGRQLYVAADATIPEDEVATTPRINVDYAGEWRDLPWRYIVKYSPFLSKPWREVTPS
jgi:DNA-3-methyladenine glycosylase